MNLQTQLRKNLLEFKAELYAEMKCFHFEALWVKQKLLNYCKRTPIRSEMYSFLCSPPSLKYIIISVELASVSVLKSIP